MIRRRTLLTGGFTLLLPLTPEPIRAAAPLDSIGTELVPLCSFPGSDAPRPLSTTERPGELLLRAFASIAQLFTVKPALELVEDGDREVCQCYVKAGTNEKIISIGKNFVAKVEASDRGEEILFGMLAHEMAHALQLTWDCDLDVAGPLAMRKKLASLPWEKRILRELSEKPVTLPGPGPCKNYLIGKSGSMKQFELHADFMSGWVLARLHKLTTEQFSGYTERLFRIGDRLMREFVHHGTPMERIQSMAAGYSFGNGNVKKLFGPNMGILETAKVATPIDYGSPRTAFKIGQAYIFEAQNY